MGANYYRRIEISRRLVPVSPALEQYKVLLDISRGMNITAEPEPSRVSREKLNRWLQARVRPAYA
jgi:hypothetical protein